MESLLFNLIFDPIKESIVQIDKDFLLVDLNQAAKNHFGYAKIKAFQPALNEISDLNLLCFLPDAHRDLFFQNKTGLSPASDQDTTVSQQAILGVFPSVTNGDLSLIIYLGDSESFTRKSITEFFKQIQPLATLKTTELISLDLPESKLYQNLIDLLSFVTTSPLCALHILESDTHPITETFISGNVTSIKSDPEVMGIIQQSTKEFSDLIKSSDLCQDNQPKTPDINHQPELILAPDCKLLRVTISKNRNYQALLILQKPGIHHDFDSQELAIISFFSQTLSQHFENKRLSILEKKGRKQATILKELLQIRNTSLDHATALEQILDQLSMVIDYDSACIMLVNENRISVAAHRRFRAQEQLDIPLETGKYPHIEQVLTEKKPIIIKDTRQDARWFRVKNTDYIRNWLGVPLIARDRVLGLLNLDKTQPDYYTDEDAELALIFANQAAIAIENAQLYDYERQRVHQLDALRNTVTKLSSELELSILLRTILERAIDFLGASGGDLGLLDETSQEIVILTSINMGSDYKDTRMQLGEGAMGLAAQTHSPIIVNDYKSWSNASPQYSNGLWHAVIAVPFLIGDRVVGAIGIIDENENRQFLEADQVMLKQFAEHAAIAVENAILLKNSQSASNRLLILHRISQEIVTASLDPEDIYASIHHATAHLMPAEAFALTLLDETNQTINAVYLVDRSGRVSAQIIPSSKGLSGQVIRSGKSIYIQDTQINDHKNTIHFGDPEKVRSVLAVPMRLRGNVIGMLSAQSYQPNAYKEEDQNLLEMLASYAAIALDNLKLFKEIQKLAITDPLTDIFNRRHIFELGQREFSRARRLKRPLSLIYLDIDHFKNVNDTLGHKTGDFVLKKLAEIIKDNTREIDILGRYGGEEFIIILVETPIRDACQTAERLRKIVNEGFQNEPNISNLTVSIGVADLKPNTSSFYHLIDEADTALYKAKNSGRNQIKAYCQEGFD